MPRHSETRHLPYTPEQMFDLVADIARYDEFLPWVVAVRIRSSSERETVADLVVGFNAFKERFTSRVTKERPGHICVDYVEGPLKYLKNEWRFEPAAKGGTNVHFSVDFAFRSRIVRKPCRADVRPRAAADDRRVRAARRSALRHQQLERAKRRLKAHAAASLGIEMFWSATILVRIAVAFGAREHDRSDRLGWRCRRQGRQFQ